MAVPQKHGAAHPTKEVKASSYAHRTAGLSLLLTSKALRMLEHERTHGCHSTSF